MQKTQIVVFRIGGKIKENEKCTFRGENITVVPCSIIICPLSMQTKKALGMLTSYSKKCGGLPVKVALQLFDKMIIPIMLYGSEVRGYM